MFSGDIFASKFYRVCEGIFNLMYVTCLLIVCSLPIFTLGASLTAFISVLRQPEYKVFDTFITVFKDNFLRSFVMTIFTLFVVMFLFQIQLMMTNLVGGNILFFVVLSFMTAYLVNIYVFLSILKKSNVAFLRQIFFFTIGTFYKGFFIVFMSALLGIAFSIIGGTPLLFLVPSVVLWLYLKFIDKDIKTVQELID